MKTSLTFILISLFIAFSLMLSTAQAQERGNDAPRVSPNASVSQTIGTTVVTVTYGRPSVNDRDVFGGLEPYGEVWRAGANEATTITFSSDVVIEGEPLSAGTYGLFTIPGEDEWSIIFNSVPNQWGAYNYDSSDDVLRVTVTPAEGPHMEQFMIYFEDIDDTSGRAILHWDTVKVPFKIEV